MGKHSSTGPSGAHRWVPCPASVQLIAALAKKGVDVVGDKSHADRGNDAHDLLETCLLTDADPYSFVGKEMKGDERTFEVDTDMAGSVAEAVKWYHQMHEALSDTIVEEMIEEHLNVEDTLAKGMYGTLDMGFLTGISLYVADFKNGFLRVSPERNEQLMMYAVMKLYTLPATVRKKIRLVHLYVIQPNDERSAQKTRKWSCGSEDLYAWMNKTLLPALAQTRQKDPPFQVGDHCRYCPAQMHCETFLSSIKEIDTMPEDIKELEGWELSDWLDRKKTIMQFFANVETEIFQRVNKGEKVPGWKIVNKQGNRKFKDKDSEGVPVKERLQSELGDAIFTEPSLKSPAQVEKISAKGKELVTELAFKPTGGPTLAPADDPRPAIERDKPMFSDVK